MTFRAILILLSLMAIQATKVAPLTRTQAAAWSTANTTLDSVAANALSAAQGENQPKSSHRSRKQDKKEPLVQTFIGTVEWEYKPLSWDCDAPNCDHFAMYDLATQQNYELDNPKIAGNYEGKKVKITGVEDAKNDVIHVLSIEETK